MSNEWIEDVSTGKTIYHKWYHEIGYLWCLIWKHDHYCGYNNDTREHFEHCRRCERYNGYGLKKQPPSLNLWFYWINFRVNVLVWWNDKKNKENKNV